MELIKIPLIIIITTAIILILLYGFIFAFYNKIYLPYKKSIVNLDFETSIFILKTIINTELESYETDIFNSKGSITNSNFENFYNDITTKIISHVSPDLIQHLSIYITEDMIYIIIARAVKKYLVEKINGTV